MFYAQKRKRKAEAIVQKRQKVWLLIAEAGNDAIDTFIALLTDEDPTIRVQAATSLLRTREKLAISALEALQEREDARLSLGMWLKFGATMIM